MATQNELLRQEISRSEKYKSLGTLTSGLAHEIRNPLTAITTFCEFLPRKLSDKKFLKSFSKIISGESTRINNLISQLLDYSKPSLPETQNTDIRPIIYNTAEFLNSEMIKRRTKYRIQLPEEPVIVPMDPSQIKQVLLNIMLNAIQAMPDGGELSISSNFKDRHFHLKIRDTGSGIKPGDMKHIFDPFFSQKDKGTGLGLSICQTIIGNHKGTITLNSKVGEGTVVIVALPLGENKSEQT